MDWKQIGSGVLFAIGALCLGFTAGGAVGGRLLSKSGMGWDRLGDMLGGMMVGLMVAVILTGATVSRLTHRQRIVTFTACMVASVLLVVVLQRTAGPSP